MAFSMSFSMLVVNRHPTVPSHCMKSGATALVLIAVIIVSAGAGYLLGANNQRTTTSVSTVISTTTLYEGPLTFSSPISQSGLQLQIRLNSTTIQFGRAMMAQVLLLNTLPANLTLIPPYSSNSDISMWGGNDFLCGNVPIWSHGGLVGFALFKGHVSSANLSSAGNPLVLAPPVVIGCITELSPSSVVMLPSSDIAIGYFNSSSLGPDRRQVLTNASTGYCTVQQNSATCGDLNGALFGYWGPSVTGGQPENATTSSPYFHYFPVGQYTLVAEDLWNQTVFAYFDVQGISLQGFSLCSSNCNYPSPYLSGSIYFNIPAPMKTLRLIVNGTDQGIQSWKCCSLLQFVLEYKGGFQNPVVVKGDSYVLKFIATFQDNTTASATTTVAAS
jgi:hypothetical protein